MAQYDVYVNPSPRSRDAVPFVVDVQSTLLSTLRVRLTMPLSRVGVDAPGGVPRRLVPQFVVEGQRLALLPHAAAGIDARLLRDAVGSLADHAGEIRDALDAVVSGV
ncbi:MAG TPA: CcdB family protein [Burkholderiaceae bacterium]|nr:CcdB family protein [Burkholderiaceae bacterium]